MIVDVFQDLRYAFRLIRKNPGFTCVVVLTLALGIGANAAIFNLTDRVLLQRLPVKSPEQLVVISSYESDKGPEAAYSFSYPMYQDLRDRNQVFQGVIALAGVPMNVSYGEQNERVRAELVSGNYFQVLGVTPLAGRLFTQDDDRKPEAHPLAVISYRFWEKRFGKDPSVVGKTILANEHPVTVIGVTPEAFFGVRLSNSPDVWVPMMMTTVFNPQPPTRLQSRRHQWLTVMARRKDGITMEEAQASLAVLYRQIRESEAEQLPPTVSQFDREEFLARRIALLPGAQGFQHLQRELRTSLLLLLGATCIVLLILCGNLTNLLLARATFRTQETAIRLALGAGRLRLLRQWLTEGLLLSLLGGFAGVFIAIWLSTGLMQFLPEDARANLDTPLGWRFILFTLFVSIVVGLAFSAIPALQSARRASSPAVNEESRSFTSAGRLVSLRSGLILLQVSLSLPLLVTAVLLLRTLHNLRSVDTGFARENVLLATLNPSLNRYSPARSQSFFSELLSRIRSLPGVSWASLASDSPLSGGWDQNSLVVEGYSPREGERMSVDVTHVSSDYFKSLGVPLVLGRDFDHQDRAGSQKVTIINQKMANYFFGTANPIGKRIGLDDVPDITIIGIVRDAQYIDLRKETRRHFYLPLTQEGQLSSLTLHVKTGTDQERIASLLRTEIKALDPHLPLYNVKTLTSEIDESLLQERLVSWLSIAFGLLATLLAALGLYGVLTFSVARRTREIGIRVALGAQRRDVLRLVISQGLILVALGLSIGVAVSIAVSQLIDSLLFGITPTNTTTFVVAATVLFVVAMLACYLPAHRATKVDPLVALRYE